jgi:hypothetical protein
VVRGQVRSEVRGQVRSEVRGQVRSEVRGQVRSEVRGRMRGKRARKLVELQLVIRECSRELSVAEARSTTEVRAGGWRALWVEQGWHDAGSEVRLWKY